MMMQPIVRRAYSGFLCGLLNIYLQVLMCSARRVAAISSSVRERSREVVGINEQSLKALCSGFWVAIWCCFWTLAGVDIMLCCWIVD